MTINKDSFTKAVTRALKAERDNVEVMSPGIGFYKQGDLITCRYESQFSSSDRIAFMSWDASDFGISDRVADMSDDEINEASESVFDIFGDELIDHINDILNIEY